MSIQRESGSLRPARFSPLEDHATNAEHRGRRKPAPLGGLLPLFPQEPGHVVHIHYWRRETQLAQDLAEPADVVDTGIG